MSGRPVRSVLLLCWRDTGHPQGGGSETYLQRIGAHLADSGVSVTLRTARYAGTPRREVVDGVQISRAGGRYSVYILAGLAMVAARIGLGPLRRVRPDVVVDTQNGLPFMARLAFGRRVAVLVHHCHREQWPVAGPVMGRIGWFVESKAVAAGAPPQPVRHRVAAVGQGPDLSRGESRVISPWCATGSTRRRLATLAMPRSATPRVAVLSRLVPHKQIEDALHAVAELRPRIPDVHLDVLGGGWWEQRLVDHAALLGISDAVTFHGHVDDTAKHHVLQRCWVHVLPSRKEGWGLAVTEAAQHAVPTIGYRSSGGLTDSIVDGVTGLLVDDHAELVDQLERLLTDQVLREQLGAKAAVRSGEFSWPQSADAMRTVLESVHAGRIVSGVV